MSWMLNEIAQQPTVVRKIIKRELSNIKNISSIIRNSNIKMVGISARGTSDNAAVLGKYLFEYIAGLPVWLSSPSLFTLYNAKINLKNSFVIGISQSGEATDICEVIKESKKQGAITLCITNTKNSTLSKVSNYTIYTHAGKEMSLAATKTFTGQLMILYLLCAYIKEDKKIIDKILTVPNIMESTIQNLMQELLLKCERYRFMERCVVIGRGFNFATSLETALKLKETTYCMAESFSAADFLHGPIAIIEKDFPVIIFAPQGKSYKMIFDLTLKLKKKYAELIIISDQDKILKHAEFPVKINHTLPEILTPIIYVLFGQIFACYLAKIKKLSPDKPRYLEKITKTR